MNSHPSSAREPDMRRRRMNHGRAVMLPRAHEQNSLRYSQCGLLIAHMLQHKPAQAVASRIGAPLF